ncbi:hypothetical protein DFJ73DRAFT_764067 [Zopfochytrium polystomum]|nr:hypothetical protein DFJ73DRAFT_764067 [Zopfochytrium polystomum]
MSSCPEVCTFKPCNEFGPATLGSFHGGVRTDPSSAYCSVYTSKNNQHSWYASPQLVLGGTPNCQKQRVASNDCGNQLDVWFDIPDGMRGLTYDKSSELGPGSYAICWDYNGGGGDGATLLEHLCTK